MRKLVEAIEAIEEGGPEYSVEGSLFAGGFDAGFDFANDQCEQNWGKGLDVADEDEIQRLFHEFAGDDTSYISEDESTDYDGVQQLAKNLGEAAGGKAVLNQQMGDSNYSDEELLQFTDNYVEHLTKTVRKEARKRVMQHIRD